MTDLTKRPHPMNGPPLPCREKQLIDRGEGESLQSYKRRVWDAEFSYSVRKVKDVHVRNALAALRQIT